VKHHRFAVISDAVNRPAPRIASAIEDLARQLHPEAFVEAPQTEKKESTNPTPPFAKQRAATQPLDFLHDFSLLPECACAR
jgi:hypothetical protein